MKPLNLIIFFFLCTSAFSQKCKFSENTKDEFTKARILSIYEDFGDFTIGYRKVNDNFYFELIYAKSVAMDMVVPSDSPIMLMLGNDSIINLYTNKIYTADIRYVNGYSVSVLKVSIPINKNQIDTINKHWIIKWRLYLTDSYIEEEIDGEYNLIDAQKVSRCILKDMPIGEMKLKIEEEKPPFEIEKKMGDRW